MENNLITAHDFLNEYRKKHETFAIEGLMFEYAKLYEPKFISVRDQKPNESDGMILVAKERSNFTEIVWISDKENELKKPFAYDKNDTPVFTISDFTHWMPLPELKEK